MHLSRERCQSEWAAVDRCSELMGVWNLAQGHFGRAPEMSYHLSCKWPSVHYFGPQLRLEPETSLAMYRLSYCSTPKLQHFSVVKSDKLGHKRVHTRPQPSNNTSNHPSIYELIHPSIHLFIPSIPPIHLGLNFSKWEIFRKPWKYFWMKTTPSSTPSSVCLNSLSVLIKAKWRKCLWSVYSPDWLPSNNSVVSLMHNKYQDSLPSLWLKKTLPLFFPHDVVY